MSEKIKFNILKYAGNPVKFEAGSVIFKKGDPGDSMYAIAEGNVDIVAQGKTVDELNDGDIFGEMSLINGEARSADAFAKTDCSLVCIDESSFLFMTENTPRFALQVMRLVTERLRARMEDLERLRS